jgi:hypothetical protein
VKPLTTIALLLLCSSARGAARSVEVIEVRPSSQNPRITVLRDGKLLPDANLEISDIKGRPKLSLRTDGQGAVKLPHLRHGQYCLTASTSPTLSGTICLKISGGHVRQPDAFSIQLFPHPPPPPTFEEKLAAAENAPVDLVTRAFSGNTVDPSGTAIRRASVAIYRQGVKVRSHPSKITTAHSGHFSAHLKPGKYTVVILSPGFEARFVTVEISRCAVENGLNVRLKMRIGAVTESVAVAGAIPNH